MVPGSHRSSNVAHSLSLHARHSPLLKSGTLSAGLDSIHLYTHERMGENLALYARIGYEEYDRRLQGAASLVYLRKKLKGSTRKPRRRP